MFWLLLLSLVVWLILGGGRVEKGCFFVVVHFKRVENAGVLDLCSTIEDELLGLPVEDRRRDFVVGRFEDYGVDFWEDSEEEW